MLKINQYFDGKVASIGLHNGELPATVGVMDVGEYTFDTSQHEIMTVVSGHLCVKLPGADKWTDYHGGDSFEVEAGRTFELRVALQTAYLCTYQDK